MEGVVFLDKVLILYGLIKGSIKFYNSFTTFERIPDMAIKI